MDKISGQFQQAGFFIVWWAVMAAMLVPATLGMSVLLLAGYWIGAAAILLVAILVCLLALWRLRRPLTQVTLADSILEIARPRRPLRLTLPITYQASVQRLSGHPRMAGVQFLRLVLITPQGEQLVFEEQIPADVAPPRLPPMRPLSGLNMRNYSNLAVYPSTVWALVEALNKHASP